MGARRLMLAGLVPLASKAPDCAHHPVDVHGRRHSANLAKTCAHDTGDREEDSDRDGDDRDQAQQHQIEVDGHDRDGDATRDAEGRRNQGHPDRSGRDVDRVVCVGIGKVGIGKLRIGSVRIGKVRVGRVAASIPESSIPDAVAKVVPAVLSDIALSHEASIVGRRRLRIGCWA
jgi:hypothetical protein